MPSPKLRTARLALLLSLSAVSGCGDKARVQPIFPPPVDLIVEADCPATDPLGSNQAVRCKPIATPEIVIDDHAAAAYSAAIEAWGERAAAAVGRLCRWAARNGMKVECSTDR